MSLTAKVRTSLAIDDSANKLDRTFVDARLYDVAMSGDDFLNEKWAVGTSHEAAPLGDVATPGMSYFRNHDGTNFVQLGIVVSGTFYPVIRLKPDEDARFRIDPTATLYGKSDTAACEVEEVVLAN